MASRLQTIFAIRSFVGSQKLRMCSPMSSQNHTLGILLSISGYTTWVVSDAFIKLSGESMPVLEIVVLKNTIGALFCVVIAAMNGGVSQLKTKRPGFHLLRSIPFIGASYGSVAGIVLLSLPDFYTIIFTAPLLLNVMGRIFLKERVRRDAWIAIFAGFLGVVVAVQGSRVEGGPFSWLGVGVTTLASVSLVLTMLTARSAVGENSYSLSVWPLATNAAVGMMVVVSQGGFTLSPSGMAYCFVGAIFGAIGLLLTNASLRVAPVAVVSPYHYTQIIGGAIASYLVWHHLPSPSLIVGATMIILSGLYILQSQRRVSTLLEQSA